MITCTCTQKTFSLGIDDQLHDEWAYRNGAWRQMKPGFRSEEWFDEYRYAVVETQDMLECWLLFLPGVVEWDYGNSSVMFDMDDVEEAGWDERKLRDVLGDMACRVRMRAVIHADKPWLTSSFDNWGNERPYYRHPAINPIDGMLEIEYPRDLEP